MSYILRRDVAENIDRGTVGHIASLYDIFSFKKDTIRTVLHGEVAHDAAIQMRFTYTLRKEGTISEKERETGVISLPKSKDEQSINIPLYEPNPSLFLTIRNERGSILFKRVESWWLL